MISGSLRSRISIVGLTSLMLLSGCASLNGNSARQNSKGVGAPLADESAEGRPIRWDDPSTCSVQVHSANEAANDYLSFQPIDSHAGTPERITVDGVCVLPERGRGIAFVYNDERGRFFVLERVAQRTQAQLQGMLQYNSETNLTRFSIVTIRDGISALLTEPSSPPGGQATSVVWLEGGLEIVVMGPMETFSTETAIDVANRV